MRLFAEAAVAEISDSSLSTREGLCLISARSPLAPSGGRVAQKEAGGSPSGGGGQTILDWEGLLSREKV